MAYPPLNMNQDSTSKGLLGVHQIPNLICVLRVVVTFASLAILADIHEREGYWSTPWIAIMTIAGLSDRLDGFLAKRYGWSSTFGAFLDQISDKLVTLALYCYMAVLGLFPLWAMALVVFRELFVTCLRISANLEQISIPTSQAGRFKTFTQQVAVLLIFMHWAWPEPVLAQLTLAQCLLWSGLLVFWAIMLGLGRRGFAGFYRNYTVPRGEDAPSIADLVLVYATIGSMALPLDIAGTVVVLVITVGTGWTYFRAYVWSRAQPEHSEGGGYRNLALAVLGSGLLSGGLWLALDRSPELLTMWIAIGVLSALWIALLTISYRTRPQPPPADEEQVTGVEEAAPSGQ